MPASAGRPTAGPTAVARRHLLDVLGPVVSSAGYDLDDIAVSTVGRRTVVRVSVDADGGIDLDGVAEVSRVVSAALDGEGAVGDAGDTGVADGGSGAAFSGPYVLEVSSPGVDRPLTEHRHWRRAVGRLVQVPVDGVQTTGRVQHASDEELTLEVDGQSRQFGWASVGTGRVQIEFNPPGPPAEEG
jgi:ribosome maturation factor RimP